MEDEAWLCGAWQPLAKQEVERGVMPFRCNLPGSHLGLDHQVILIDAEGVKHQIARWPRRIESPGGWEGL